jgi:hypothetical protein
MTTHQNVPARGKTAAGAVDPRMSNESTTAQTVRMRPQPGMLRTNSGPDLSTA